jgi:hypothetical protein
MGGKQIPSPRHKNKRGGINRKSASMESSAFLISAVSKSEGTNEFKAALDKTLFLRSQHVTTKPMPLKGVTPLQPPRSSNPVSGGQDGENCVEDGHLNDDYYQNLLETGSQGSWNSMSTSSILLKSSNELNDDSSQPETLNAYLYQQSSFNSTVGAGSYLSEGVHAPTVQVPYYWRLVYMGNECSYACSGIIPQDVLDREPEVKAAVMFSVQVIGIDWPEYERSQLSAPVIFYTVPDPDNDINKKSRMRRGLTARFAINPGRGAADCDDNSLTTIGSLQSNNHAESNTAANASSATANISKTKRSIIKAVVNAHQMIKIERKDNNCYSEGVGESFD